jgi:hypothetical protein
MKDHPEMNVKPRIRELRRTGYLKTAKTLALREIQAEIKAKEAPLSNCVNLIIFLLKFSVPSVRLDLNIPRWTSNWRSTFWFVLLF